jgi:hypothetical protein
MAGRLTPRQAAGLAVAFVLGGIAAVAAERLTRDTGTNPSSETLARADVTVGGAPVDARVIRLPEGYVQRLTQEGTTLNLVQSGRVEVELGGQSSEYIAGTSFLVPAGRPYILRALETVQLSVVVLGASSVTVTAP